MGSSGNAEYMGSLLRRFKGLKVINMLRLVFVVAFASAAPLEDTPEVAEAKAAFKAAFDAAAAGEHAALAPVNNDIQAEQIAAAYLDDLEEVVAAKAAFKAAFDDAAAGGLAAKQAPAPVHVLPEPVAAPTVVPAAINYANIPAVYPYFGYNHVLPQLTSALPAFGLTGLQYNGLPIIA